MKTLTRALSRLKEAVELEWRINVIRYYAAKVVFQFPYGRWVSYGEIMGFGCPDKYLWIVLGLLVDLDRLDTRVHFGFSDEIPLEV